MAPSASGLPPTVEEAYRRKCIQLKQRYKEVEDVNDATRIRLARIKRQVRRLRLERVFLLEQLTKRTSTNVEDSEGSPSPPPTPKEKPLRTKRGHRKPSLIANLDTAATPGSTFISQNPANLSPSSDAFSHAQAEGDKRERANGVAGKPPKKPANAFELYCDDARPALKAKAKDDKDGNVEEELARGWKDLPDKDRDEFQVRYEEDLAKYQKDKETFQKAKAESKSERSAEPGAEGTPSRDEDVEMRTYESDQETQDAAEKDE